MSAENACVVIGLDTGEKIPAIGTYVQNSGLPPGPAADGPYIGVNGSATAADPVSLSGYYWTENFLGEDVGEVMEVPGNSGVAAGKNARWVTTGGATLTVPADSKCAVDAAGVVTALTGTGTYITNVPATKVIPAGAFLWVFEL